MAIINIGSGSVKLYLEKSRTTQAKVTLLASYENKNDLTALDETFNAVEFFYHKAVGLGEQVCIFGTESMRKIGYRLTARIFDKLGLTVDIISGKDEALCGFLGCVDKLNNEDTISNSDGNMHSYSYDDTFSLNSQNDSAFALHAGITNHFKDNSFITKAKTAVIDVGGASTELSVGTDYPDFCASYPVGSVDLFNRFEVIDNPPPSFLPGLYNYIDKVFENIKHQDFRQIGKIKLIGGGATNLAAMLLNLYIFDAKAVEGYAINVDTLPRFIQEMFNMTVAQRVQSHPFLEEKRALVLPYGIAIIYRLLNILPKAKTTVSTCGLIQGYLKLKNR